MISSLEEELIRRANVRIKLEVEFLVLSGFTATVGAEPRAVLVMMTIMDGREGRQPGSRGCEDGEGSHPPADKRMGLDLPTIFTARHHGVPTRGQVPGLQTLTVVMTS